MRPCMHDQRTNEQMDVPWMNSNVFLRLDGIPLRADLCHLRTVALQGARYFFSLEPTVFSCARSLSISSCILSEALTSSTEPIKWHEAFPPRSSHVSGRTIFLIVLTIFTPSELLLATCARLYARAAPLRSACDRGGGYFHRSRSRQVGDLSLFRC